MFDNEIMHASKLFDEENEERHVSSIVKFNQKKRELDNIQKIEDIFNTNILSCQKWITP
jgi:hypothetical protein